MSDVFGGAFGDAWGDSWGEAEVQQSIPLIGNTGGHLLGNRIKTTLARRKRRMDDEDRMHLLQ